MIIVHLIDYFQPKVGYQEYFLAREQQKMGHNVLVVTSDRFFPFINYKSVYGRILGERKLIPGKNLEEGVDVIRLPSIEIVPGRIIWLHRLSKILKELNPDLVFCHNVYSLTSYLSAFYKNKIGYKLIYDTHASFFNTNFTESFIKRVYHFLHQKLAVPLIKKKADKIFAIGEEERRFICSDFQLDQKNIPIIRLGVDTQLFSFSKDSRFKTRKRLGLSEVDILLIFAGKITFSKDVHVLLDAFSELRNSNLKLLIIGGGEKKYIENLKNSYKLSGIYWQDFVENKELPSYYSAADIGVWPGDPSTTMLEAMAVGLPLIIPEWEETKYLDKSEAVVRFERENSGDLSKKINNLLEDTKNLEKLKKNAHKYAKKELSWIKIAKKTLKLIQNYHF